MTTIKDSVHDYIEVGPVAAALLDTPELQRLRSIRQLATVQLVYPSANHTRFEHSLGVYHLADRALGVLGIDGERAAHVRAAALCHDVGHGPFGHQTERVIERRLGRHHDEIGHLLDGGGLGEALATHGLDPEWVAALVDGRGPLGGLVSGALDVDRMDYLVRDAHHTGVPYGTIDHGRLLRALELRDGELVVGPGNLASAESTLVARTLMNATVYRHHVSRVAGAMLDRASERLLDADAIDPEAFARLTDAQALAALADCEATADTARRLRDRDLYKRAIWADWDAVDDELVGVDHDRTGRLEREIATAAGCRPDRVILDAPAQPTAPESRAKLVVDGRVRRLDERSTLVSGLAAAERDRWRLGVYAPAECRERVADAAAERLGLPDSARSVPH